MSLVPCFVQAADGNWYKDPHIAGPDWFICFDDDDPPELVMQKREHDTPHRAEHRAMALLIENGVPATVAERQTPAWCGRMFNGDFKKAWSIWLDWKGPLPMHLIPEGAKPCKAQWREGVYYGDRTAIP